MFVLSVNLSLKCILILITVTTLIGYCVNENGKMMMSRIPNQDGSQHDGRCELIKSKLCEKIEYNMTYMPNIFNHQEQSDASTMLSDFMPLVKAQCNDGLLFFLCSVYLPFCSEYGQPVPPCRSFCISSKKGCDDVLKNYSLYWPEELNCDRFPEHKLCINKNTSTDNFDDIKRSGDVSIHFNDDQLPKYSTVFKDFTNHGFNSKYHEFVCPYQFKVPKGYGYSFQLNDKLITDCGLPCDEMFFTAEDRQFAKVWVGGWASICSLCCLFTVLTFSINMDRFKYPERPIIFLSLCSLVVSSIYLIAYFSTDNIACRKPFPSPSQESTMQMVSPISQGTKGEWCTILFIGLYFFSMASSIWWVILALTWFLAAGLKWGHEAIEANSQYFHLAAWALPAVKTIIILALGKVEGK